MRLFLYDRCYVLVGLDDMVNKASDEQESSQRKNIILPHGKQLFILSLNTLDYYHSYELCMMTERGNTLVIYSDRRNSSGWFLCLYASSK